MIKNFLKGSSLFKHSAIYLITEGLNKAIPFIILPIISYYLTPSDYGILANYNVITQILAVFCYSITTVIIPVMYYKLGRNEVKSLISNIVILNSIIGVLLLLITLLVSKTVEQATSVSLFFQIIAVVSTLFASFTQVNLALWRCEEKPFNFGLFHISQTALDAGLSLYLIIVVLLGWSGRVYSMALASIIFGILSLILLFTRGYLKFCISKQHIATILAFSIPLLPHGLSFWIKSGADKLLLSNLSGLNQNGLYSVAMSFGAIVSIFVTSFNNAFVPKLFQKLKSINPTNESDIKIRIVRQYRYLVVGLLILTLLSYIVSYAFIKIVYQPEYSDAVYFLPYIMLGQFFTGVYSLFVNFLHYTQNTKVLGAITFSLTLLQILLSFCLIKWVGPVGAAISSAIVSLLIAYVVAIYSNSVFPMPWANLFKSRK